MKSEMKIDTYRYKPLDNFCYLATVAELSENKIEMLKSSRSAQNRLEEWKSELKEFTNCPPILRIGQFEVPTHTILEFSGHNPFHLRSMDEQKEMVPSWVIYWNVNTEPRFFTFGFDTGKPSSLFDQELIACAGNTPIDSLFGIHIQKPGNSEYTEPKLLEVLDHIVLPTMIVFCVAWRFVQIQTHSSRIEKLPEFDEDNKKYAEEIRNLNALEEHWENLYRSVQVELDEFNILIEYVKSERDFIRIPEIPVQKWGKRHLAVDDELNDCSFHESLIRSAQDGLGRLEQELDKVDEKQERKSDIVDTRIDREAHLREKHWISRPWIQVILAVATILGGAAAAEQLFHTTNSVSPLLSVDDILSTFLSYLYSLSLEVYILLVVILLFLIYEIYT